MPVAWATLSADRGPCLTLAPFALGFFFLPRPLSGPPQPPQPLLRLSQPLLPSCRLPWRPCRGICLSPVVASCHHGTLCPASRLIAAVPSPRPSQLAQWRRRALPCQAASSSSGRPERQPRPL